VKQEPVVPQRFLPKKGSSSSMKGNSNVSHSVAEKQRRDRINTLIDELRELVPIDLESAEASNQPYGEDPSKRPKHVVLSDTIKFVRNTLIRQQQQQQQEQQQQVATTATARVPDEVLRIRKELADNGTTSDITPVDSNNTAENNGEKQRSECSSGRYRTQSTSSQDSFESGDEIEINVTEMEDNKNYSVNVNGKDRNGLLHDITRALKTLDLEIKTAVIETNTTGKVNDSFEVDKSYCTLTTKEIETKLRGSLFHETEMKRKRTLEGGAADNLRRSPEMENNDG
jgi:UTP:GlnB (protein PII) uridylyltransferase